MNSIIFHKGKVLLLKHKKLGSWLGPGGHIEPNETPDEALLREIKEEAGIEVRFIGDTDRALGDGQAQILHSPFVIQCELIKEPKNEHYHIDMVYLCKSDTDVTKANDESSNIGWFTYEETEKLEMFPNFRSLLKKAFRYMKATSSIC